jgi:hypothetical protein
VVEKDVAEKEEDGEEERRRVRKTTSGEAMEKKKSKTTTIRGPPLSRVVLVSRSCERQHSLPRR